MSEKLLPCPFCGSTDLEILPEDPSRDGNAWGAVQCVNVDCSTYDILKSHGVRVEDGQDVSDDRGSDAYKSAAIAAWNRRTPAPEGEAWRTVPVEPTEAMLVNGREALMPLVRLDSYGPLIGVWEDMLAASPVVPVGVSREDIAKTLFERHWSAVSASPKWPGDDDGSYWLWLADAIIAALRPTDTRRE
jgi:hypothetical protein